ncbi:MAG: bifunctional hydroxymethylpyrimidine kinase/phosphomethylpyrimidine kinase [Eubacteriaceae bacterium]|jgi:hydroxymethylpyrimidine/phosphomethylpyrimidine kinase|nr:bifunctional hydroxymethylpyrimidine kinase/phosphomethylpyrimidine kinase [Eubacteriaceae bacterium]
MKKVLTIAGSDSSGGAGIQADLKTIAAHKMYGMSAVTSLTAQNTTGVYGVFDAPADFVASEIDCVFSDIRPDAVKIGMVSSAEIIEAIAGRLTELKAENIVADPVMVSTSGSRLLRDDAADTLMNRLLPLADVITPNLREAEVLADMKIISEDDMVRAAEKIASGNGTAGVPINGGILIKGGHLADNANDLLFAGGRVRWLKGERVNNPNTHGTGCTLSSAIACGLAAGRDLFDAVAAAKEYITGALEAGLDLGTGSGPLDHLYCLEIKK